MVLNALDAVSSMRSIKPHLRTAFFREKCRKPRTGAGRTEPNWLLQSLAMLDYRAQTLLKTLIERYIAEGQPVGSRTLSRYSGLELSPATIRNVMSDLEEMGFIASPHTSAGRVPTPLGYRLFVDSLLTVKPLPGPSFRKSRTPSTRTSRSS
jgi:hypothetical protein